MTQSLERFAARRRYGLTATLSRSDALEAMIPALMGRVLIGITRREQVLVRVHRWENGGEKPAQPHEVLERMQACPRRRAMLARLCLGRARQGRRPMVLSSRLELLEHMEEALASAGVAVGRLYGNRRDAKAELDASHVVLASFQMASEGVDLPSRDCLVLAMPCTHHGLVEQVVGRVTRGSTAERAALVDDVADDWKRAAASARRRLYASKGWQVEEGGEATALAP